MFETWVFTIISVLIVSLISLIGVLTLSLKEKRLEQVLLFFVSFAAGAFFGDVFIHLLPESIKENGFNLNISLYVLSGIIFLFIVEKIIRWRHCHIPVSKEHYHPLSTMVLIGDTVHNFIDGLVIGSSYLAGISIGIATTLAVIFHEIPQEIGDFSTLIYSGYTKSRALLFNFLSGFAAVFGAVLVLIVNSYISLTSFLIPFTAGTFIYIAGSDLIPELHKELKTKKSIIQLVSFIIGILIMLLLTYL